MNAKILNFPLPLREVPTQEIRSIYEDLYLEQIRKQSMEQVMIEMHERMYRLWWLAILAWDGILAFVIGFLVGEWYG